MAKSWTEQLNDPAPPVLRRMTRDFGALHKGELVLLPSARMVNDAMRMIPKGAALSITALRQKLAKATGADVTCPVYMGYRLRAVAEAMLEQRAQGIGLERLTPVWRVLDARTPTLAKLKATDRAWVSAQRRREGLPA